jgi:hypothetical protein
MTASLRLSAAGALPGIRSVVAGVAPAGADCRVVHRIGRETRRRVDMTIAALECHHRDMRRCRHAGRRGAVVAARAIGIGGRVNVGSARPAGECRSRTGVAGDTVGAVCWDVASERCGALRTLRAFAGERAVVAGVAPAGADRAVIHGVGRKARCGVVVAVAALNSGYRNVRRRCHAGRGGAVVAARTIGVARSVGELAARPAGEGRSRAGVTGDAVAAVGRDVTGERCRAQRAGCALAGK